MTEICSLTGAPNAGSFWFLVEIGKAKTGEGTTDLTKKLTAENVMVVMMGVTVI